MTQRSSLSLATLLLAATAAAGAAAQDLRLRAEVQARTDILSLADLVEGATGAAAAKPLFRAPALGDNGTIQVNRIVEAAGGLGVSGIDTGGRAQVLVSRAARRIGAGEMEAVLKRALEARHGLEAETTTVVFDAGTPPLVVDPETRLPLGLEELSYDPRSRRLAATLSVAGSGGRRNAARVTGIAVETATVAVLNRPVGRGETVQAGDVTLERRAREGAPADSVGDIASIAGRAARRALNAGTLLRAADLNRPEVVARNETVTIVYAVPGLTLTLRGKALEAGAVGNTIAVQNQQSKRTLQASVVAPGRVAVAGPPPGPLAANTAQPAATKAAAPTPMPAAPMPAAPMPAAQ